MFYSGKLNRRPRVAIDRVRGRADLARLARRPTCFQDADVERAFPSIDHGLVLLLQRAMGVSSTFTDLEARLWGICEWHPDTGFIRRDPALLPRGLLSIPGTAPYTIFYGRGAMEGTRLGPFLWQAVGACIVYSLRSSLGDKLWFMIIVADDLKVEHRPQDTQLVATTISDILHKLGLSAAGAKWYLFQAGS